MDRVRQFGWIYFAGFMAIVAVGYVPPFHDAQGNLFGLFSLDLYDDSLHFFSGVWAGIAAWWSYGAARTYFRLFGPLYFADGVMGLFLGRGYLDGGIFLYGPLKESLYAHVFANLPHLVIGGVAIWVGYRLARATGRRVRRRWRVLIAAGVVVAGSMLAPIAYIEGGCRHPLTGVATNTAYTSLLPPADRRPEAQSFLTYPEWYIVYEAEAFARHLAAGRPPSSFAYGGQIAGFWRGYCAVNRVTTGSTAAANYKVTIYTIGISFTAELAIKAAYERTMGRLFEWASGWTSADDHYATAVQSRYGAFLHETPWYRFPFGRALGGEWRTHEPHLHARHWERRVALSSEYGVKAAYAALIDAATGATVGRDELTLRFVAKGAPAQFRAIDPRLVLIGTLPGGLTIVRAPRYQQFNDLLAKMATAGVALVEIAGNDDILVTVLLPDAVSAPGAVVFRQPIEKPGWSRVGMAVTVSRLFATMRDVRAGGGVVEHVYDY